GTASGKTSTLNSLAMFIPVSSKIVGIEDTREINLLHENWIPAVTREADAEGRSIDMFALLRSALRQRPEYILVGEVRGREAYILFQAMATGHITFSTIHADSAEAVVRRLTKPPIDVPLMLLDSLNIIALHAMVRIGTKRVRRCLKVLEVLEVDFANERLKTNEVFGWRPDEFEFSGESKVFQEIMAKLTLTKEDVEKEFSRRVRILRHLQEKGPNDFYELSRLFFQYNLDPRGTAERLGVA
ncbi:MAG: type II/IV secretion system ATPase subunit, partial [Chloroflexi bacterium]|nr:type II/IV secretion system ATPase subunit [Chloroflexota bacterium]